MKTWILLLTVLLTAPCATAADPLAEALQRGLLAEDARKDLAGAAAAYREAIELGDRQRTMVATALFRLAEAERALGRTNEAVTWYLRLMREYPEATNLTALAARRLPEGGDGADRRTATLHADLVLMKDLLRGYREERQRFIALTNDVIALALALKASHPTPELEGLIRRINDVEVALEALKSRYKPNHPRRQEIEAQIPELQRQIAVENTGILGRLQAREVEFETLIARQEDALARTTSATGSPAPGGSSLVGPEKFLVDEIALAEQQLKIANRRHDLGHADTEEVLKASREVLSLKRQLAAMQSRPKDIVDPVVPSFGELPDEEAREIERLKRLLANSPDLLNAPQGPENETPLQTAARLDQARVVEYLLQAGAGINALGGKGVTALYAAAEAGHKRMVELLLRAGADVNAGANGRTPLLIAVPYERTQVIETLLDAGASPNIQIGPVAMVLMGEAYERVSPFGLALLRRNLSLVEAMARHGADLNAPCSKDQVPLGIALSQGDWDIAALLLKLGANPEGDGADISPLRLAMGQSASPPPRELLDQLLAHGARLDQTSTRGETLLHLAVRSGSSHAVEWLLHHRASPSAPDADGVTPLMIAVWRRIEANDESQRVRSDRILSDLIAAGADVKSATRFTDDPRPGEQMRGPNMPPNGPPLSWVAVSMQTNLFRQLLSAGADPNTRNSRGMPLLYLMAAWLYPGMDPGLRVGALANARALLQAGAAPDVGFDGRTPLQIAVQSFPELVKLLLEFKADPNRRDNQGRSPLELVSDARWDGQAGLDREQQEQVLRALRAAGARDDAPDFQTIRVVRPSSRFTQILFRRNGTNDANRFTLLEALAVHYGILAAPAFRPEPSPSARAPVANQAFPSPGSPEPVRPGSAPRFGAGSLRSLPFPDWKRVVIRRPDSDGAQWTEIPVDVEEIFAPGGCDKDVVLHWGDVIEVPERDHAIREQWPRLPVEAVNAWAQCLAREVTVHVQGKETPVTLERVVEPWDARPTADSRFTLTGALSVSGLLRASSDASRVVLRRKEPATGAIVERIFDCRERQGEGASVWLQKGDEILVPEL